MDIDINKCSVYVNVDVQLFCKLLLAVRKATVSWIRSDLKKIMCIVVREARLRLAE